MAGSLFTLAVAVVLALLPGPATVTAYADTPETFCFVDQSGQVTCPHFAPADLIPPETLQGVAPATREALRQMEEQAVDEVLAAHGLPASDRDAVLSYARYDALAELWALIVQALENTTDRTASRDRRCSTGWAAGCATSVSSRRPTPRSSTPSSPARTSTR